MNLFALLCWCLLLHGVPHLRTCRTIICSNTWVRIGQWELLCFLPQNYVLPCWCMCRISDLSNTIQNPGLEEILYLYYWLSNYRGERFSEQHSSCLVALRAARTSFAVFVPNAFKIKSSLDKDNDSCCAKAWRDSWTRGSWVQACLRKRNILCCKNRSYCLYQPSATVEVEEKGMMKKCWCIVQCCEDNQTTFVFRKVVWSTENYGISLLFICFKIGWFITLVLSCHWNTV